MSHTTVAELALWRRHGFDFDLIDVRKAVAREASGVQIDGSRWLDPAAWLDWKDDVAGVDAVAPPGTAASTPTPRPLLLVCAHGHELSRGLAAALRAMDCDARHLQGGLAAWRKAGHDVVPIDSRAQTKKS